MKRTVEIDVTPTPRELAEAWCGMDADEQALFFNAVAKYTEREHSRRE